MKLNKKMILLFAVLFILVIGTTAISAASNNNTNIITSDNTQSTVTTASVINTTQSTDTNTENIVKEDTSNQNSNAANVVEKTTDKQSQQSDQQSITPKATVTKKATKTIQNDNSSVSKTNNSVTQSQSTPQITSNTNKSNNINSNIQISNSTVKTATYSSITNTTKTAIKTGTTQPVTPDEMNHIVYVSPTGTYDNYHTTPSTYDNPWSLKCAIDWINEISEYTKYNNYYGWQKIQTGTLNGTTIILKEGVYDCSSSSGHYTSCYEIDSGVQINIKAEEGKTVIINGNGLPILVYGVTDYAAELINGHPDPGSIPTSFYSPIYGSSLNITNITFVNGSYLRQYGSDYVYGAITYVGNLTVENCTFTKSDNDNGGSIIYASISTLNRGYQDVNRGNLTVNNCNFINNTGRAINIDNWNNLTISNSLFENNTSQYLISDSGDSHGVVQNTLSYYTYEDVFNYTTHKYNRHYVYNNENVNIVNTTFTNDNDKEITNLVFHGRCNLLNDTFNHVLFELDYSTNTYYYQKEPAIPTVTTQYDPGTGLSGTSLIYESMFVCTNTTFTNQSEVILTGSGNAYNYGYDSSGKFLIQNSTFTNIIRALQIIGFSNATVKNCTFINDTYMDGQTTGGAIYFMAGGSRDKAPSGYKSVSNLTVIDSHFYNDTAGSGGAVYVGYYDPNDNIESHFNTTNSYYYYCLADYGTHCGAVYANSTDMDDYENLYSNNVYIPSEMETNLTAKVLNNSYYNTTIEVTVTNRTGTPVSKGVVSVLDNNGNYLTTVNTLTLKDGKINITLNNLDYNTFYGNQTITIHYIQNNVYYANSTNLTFTPQKLNTTITPTISSDLIGIASVIFNVRDNDKNYLVTNGTLKVYNETGDLIESYALTSSNQPIAINLYNLALGNHTLKAYYTESDKYNGNNTEITVTIKKINTYITPTILNNTIGNSKLQIAVYDVGNNYVTSGNVSVYDADNNILLGNGTLTNGLMNMTLNTLSLGDHNLYINYSGTDDKYNISNITSKLTINKINTTIVPTIIRSTVVDTTLEITVTNKTGDVVKEGTLNVYNESNVKIGNATITNGAVNITLTNLTLGNHKLTINYTGVNNYNSSSTTQIINVNKINTITTPSLVNNIIGNSVLNININDVLGNVVTNGTVNVYDADTNKLLGSGNVTDGVVTINLDTLTLGDHNLFVNYTGTTDKYYGSNNTTTVKIVKIDTVITMDNVNGTTNQNISIIAIVKDTNGNLINQETVTFTDTNGLSKTVNVNNGIATINTTYATRGNYTITARYNGNDVYSSNETTAIATITVNSIVMNVTVIPGTTTSNTTFNITVKDTDGNPVDDGKILIYENNTLISNTTVINGTAVVKDIIPISGNQNITVIYNSTIYNSTNKTVNFTINKSNTTIVINPIVGVVKNTIDIQANVTDQFGNLVKDGRVAFKINGTTLKDINGNVIYANVINGIAKINYLLTRHWVKDNLTFSAVYSGSDLYNSARNTTTVNVIKRTAIITEEVTQSPVIAQDETKFLAIVRDSNGTVINDGQVVFKFQGHTIKDKEGNTVLVNVTNGKAALNYTIFNGISSKIYNITAVYANPDYYRAETKTPLVANKIGTYFDMNTSMASRGSNTTLISGTIKDNNGNLVLGTRKISIKISGKTLRNSTSGTVFYVTNGKINTNVTIPSTLKNTQYTITLITGTTNGYKTSTGNTILKYNS